jgi:toxin CptA
MSYAYSLDAMTELFIKLQPSRKLGILLSMAHCTAAGVFWPLTLPAVVKILVTLLLASSLCFYLWRYVWLISPQAIVSLRLTEKNHCRAWMLSNNYIDYRIDGDTFVAPYMTVLCLKVNQAAGRRTIVILPDAIDAEAFRQLRVWLRWKWGDDLSYRDAR